MANFTCSSKKCVLLRLQVELERRILCEYLLNSLFMRSNLKLKLFAFLSILLLFAYSQTILEPGIDRWTIKTSAANFIDNANPKSVSLKTLIKLPLIDKEYSSNDYDEVLIPKKVGALKEGDIISTKGYLHLVALENSSNDHRDGDYHIQLTLHPEWTDSCFIVEIPFEDFVSNTELKALCVKNRNFIKKRLLKDENKEPSGGGNIMQHEVYVKVTGQLFYDAIHASQMRNPNPAKRKYRGKKGNSKNPMHSYTAWEIHPVTNIEFAVKPK